MHSVPKYRLTLSSKHAPKHQKTNSVKDIVVTRVVLHNPLEVEIQCKRRIMRT